MCSNTNSKMLRPTWGLQNGRGRGACGILPLRKAGGGAQEVLAILKGGGAQTLKEGARKVLPCLDGGTLKVSDL